MTYGRYRVLRGSYRRHDKGDVFEARLGRAAEPRAIRRGDIELLETFTPAIVPGSYQFPQGWLTKEGA